MDRVFNGDYASNKLTAAILRLFLPRAGGTVSRNERLDCWLVAGLWLMIVISAITFITLSDKPVFDDIPNLRDVTRYSNDGVSMATLANHVNPAGPFAYIWIALIGALLGGALWSFRLVNALGTLVLGGALLWVARRPL